MPHIHEKIDFTVEVFIVHNKRVLLRKHDKYHIWLSVGGHIELHEDPVEAALREVMEEVGLTIRLIGEAPTTEESATYHELLSPRYLNRHRISDTHEHVSLIYFATSTNDQVTADTGHEQSEAIRWFTDEELDLPAHGIRDNIRFYAHAALRAA